MTALPKVIQGAILEFKGVLRAKVIGKDKTHTTLLWQSGSPGMSRTSCYRTYGLELDKNWQRVPPAPRQRRDPTLHDPSKPYDPNLNPH